MRNTERITDREAHGAGLQLASSIKHEHQHQAPDQWKPSVLKSGSRSRGMADRHWQTIENRKNDPLVD
jgi:hypothetical protein